ncbi:MAG TPA: ATP-binding cassette domain-containing protein [Actinomycetota bacterium]|nr:ATP-binding cassette domain-containing protein [Actinomycetota bacterium]
MITIAGFEITGPVLLLGTVTGITYGLLAVGLVLVFRSNRLINFAHGEIGALGAAVLGVAVVRWKIPYWAALPGALALSAFLGGLTEVAVVRRLRNVPNLMSIVATLGVAQFLLVFSFVVNAQAGAGRLYPQPPGFLQFDVGPLRVTQAYFGMLVLTPVLVAGLAYFLRRTRYGIAIRGAADNADAARMAGVSSGRMSMLSWAIAGAVSAFTAIMIFPTRGFITAETLGPSLLLRALVAAVVARMRSLPIALGAGVGVGILEQELLWNFSGGGLVEATLFVIILLALLLQPRHGGREEEKGSWASVQPWPPLHESLRKVWGIRNMGWIAAGAMLAVAVVLGFAATNATSIILVVILSFGLVGLSLGVVTGLGGQLSLGQFAVAGIGATASTVVVSRTGNFFLGFAAAGAIAAVASALIGLPALRIRGLMLAVTTLSFALATQSWLLSQDWMLGEGKDPGRPIFGDTALDTGKRYYLFSLIFIAAGLLLARNVWRGAFGRRLRALRDNEDNARAFTVRATLVKLQAFAVAGFLAGLGGAVYGHALSRLSNTAFPVGSSIDIVAMSALGGIGLLAGPLIGAFYIIGLPQFLPLDSAGLAATKLGWLILILYVPGGIAALVRPIRDRIVTFLARGVTLEEPAVDVSDDGGLRRDALVAPSSKRDAKEQDGVVLSVSGLTKRYGGVVAVSDVGFEIRSGSTVGIIGPNGAGKTTLFELIGGFTSPDEGSVVFEGRDISRLSPESRGQLGLIRSFQDASLFPTMTVQETVQLALERRLPTRVLTTLVGFDRRERRRAETAREVVELMGLGAWRHKACGELSTGTRRITEIACMVALEPKVLLLDEPSSGVAQRETEALGELLRRVKSYLGTTLIVIEHDMPLIMGLSDRIIAMESGRIIADGKPAAVRADTLVIESYLGGDIRTIQRSGSSKRPRRKPARRKGA